MSKVGRIFPCQYKAHLKIDGLLGGLVGLMVGMRVCRAWEELGMKGRTISGSVGAFFTLLNMSEYVHCTGIALLTSRHVPYPYVL